MDGEMVCVCVCLSVCLSVGEGDRDQLRGV